MENSRREFIKNVSAGSAAVAFGGIGLGLSAGIYSSRVFKFQI